MSGARSGPGGNGRDTFLYTFIAAATIIGAVNVTNVITIQHEWPTLNVLEPIIWEGSSWLTILLFLWIPWTAYRFAPPLVRPRWKLLIHAPGALAFSVAHVAGFVLLRKLAYWALGGQYNFGAALPHFLYELRKDVLDYAIDIAAFTLFEHLLRWQQQPAVANASTFDIRDGRQLLRVPMAEILAISSAGNYVEFALRDGRKPLMRSPLSAIESELSRHGFVRVHRSWLVNPALMTALKPDGSGDYTVELGHLSVPLSRRFPDALAKLRAA